MSENIDRKTLIITEDDQNTHHAENIENDGLVEQYYVGQWLHVNINNGTPEEETKLMCCIRIGSNFIEVDQPGYSRPSLDSIKDEKSTEVDVSRYCFRIHFNDLERYKVKPVDDSATEIRNEINRYSRIANDQLSKIKEITSRLGLRMDGLLSNNSADAHTGTSVATLSQAPDIKEYENSLVVAKTKTLPALFNNLKMAHAGVAQWMGAESLAMGLVIGSMKETVKEIDDRLFNVSLYAGLEEHIRKCADGEPAEITERLHVMQKKRFMDEECLMNYTAGGMEFDNIIDFDDWISKPENRDRLLPFPRTVVAFQVRRFVKERPWLNAFVQISHQVSDKFTYLYVRNGEQVWRVGIDKYDFRDEAIFPGKSTYNPSEPLMFKYSFSRVESFMTKSEYDTLFQQKKERKEAFDAWRAENPDVSSFHYPGRDPHWDSSELDKYHPFDDTSVYYDDAVAMRAAEMARYNRVALIIQGIFDRSEVLIPHLPVKTWQPESFARSIELVYDMENVLYEGEKPDFVAYQAKINAMAKKDAFFVGQQFAWMKDNAEKFNSKGRDSFGQREKRWAIMYVPGNDAGMGNICRSSGHSKRGVTFKWQRESARSFEIVNSKFTANWKDVFNVSDYTPGDYLKFFNDPRTREEYINWAPFLLSAEDYWAQKAQGLEEPKDPMIHKYRSVFVS